jgi:hypothetical protein
MVYFSGVAQSAAYGLSLSLTGDWSSLRQLEERPNGEINQESRYPPRCLIPTRSPLLSLYEEESHMPSNGMTISPTAKSIASYVKKNALHVKKAQKAHKHQRTESVREADYKGHHIVITTQYQIEVDGKMVMGHLGVTNDGQVHYHPVPNLSFASAVDLVKQLINIFPDDFVAKGNRKTHRRKMKRTLSGHKHT